MGLMQIYLPLLCAVFQLGADALWGVNSCKLVVEVLTDRVVSAANGNVCFPDELGNWG